MPPSPTRVPAGAPAPDEALQVQPFSGRPAEWDAFVSATAGATHCHLYGWSEVIARVHRHRTHYLEARHSDGTLAGILPLVSVQSPLFGRYLVSMPFLNYGGPIGSDAAVRALAAEAVRLAAAERAKLLELRSRRELALDLPVSHRKITVVLDLPPGGGEAAWTALKAKVRSQVRRPQKEGVEVRFGPDQVTPFYAVYAHHMRDLGTPVQPLSLFRAIAEQFADSAWFGCAWYKGEPVAGGAGFVFGGEFEMTWASALNAHSRIAPNMLLYWAFMERAANAGLSAFNFGRCTPGGGTHRFKQQWGSRDETLWWYQGKADAVQATPAPDQGAYAMGPRVWKRLPVPLATALGPWIVRGIP